MLANVADLIITPPLGIPLFEPRDAPARAVQDDLHARALVLSDGHERCCIVTLDLLGLDDEWVQRVRQAVDRRVGLPASHLMLNASHTHNAPLTLACCPTSQPKRDHAWEDGLVEAITDCIARATENLIEVTLSAGHAPLQIGINRRLSILSTTRMLPNPLGLAMTSVDVLRVQRADGSPLAVLFSHAAHPVTIHDSADVISADYPGVATRIVQQQLGKGAVAMFAQGCAGDINVKALRGGQGAAEEIGFELADAVLNADCTSLPDGTLRVYRRSARLPYEHISREVAGQIAECTHESSAALAMQDADARMLDDQQSLMAWANNMMQWSANEDAAGMPFEATGFALGPSCAILGLPHEPFYEYQRDLQSQSPFEHTFVFGYTNHMLGYVPTAAAFYLGGYEVQGAHKFFGLPRLLPACEAIVKKTSISVLRILHSSE